MTGRGDLKDFFDIRLVQTALASLEELQAVAVRRQMAGRDHHGAVAVRFGKHAAHEHGGRGSHAAVQHGKAHLVERAAHRRLQRRTRKTRIPAHRHAAARRSLSAGIRQPEAEAVGNVFRRGGRQVDLFSKQIRRDASHVAAVLQFAVVLQHLNSRNRRLMRP